MKSYPAIEDHGLIGDLQTAALVTCDGTIDWFCAPRFDSPSVFCALLDKDKGGFFQIAPHDVRYVTKQLYLPGTPILITRFISADGVAEVMDFMPVTGERVTDSHRIVRMVNMVRGTMRFRVECRPRFDFARERHELERHRNGYLFRSRSATLTFNPIDPVRQLWAKTGEIRMEDGDLIAYGTLQEGDTGGVVLETSSEEPRIIPPEEVQGMFEWTRDYWRRWVERSRYTGRWREMVERSAITLKLMTYAPTGAMIAAPTAALPELVGGSRNWDYRYTWVRDTSFSVHALLGLGFTEEVSRYMDWLDERIREAGDHQDPLKIMYRVDGSSDLHEEVLDHLEGYRGSRPVRIGNGAADQLQLDIHGEALYAMHLADEQGIRVSHQVWKSTVRLIDWLCHNWDKRDAGIWESRHHPRNYTFGRVMSWVALDRAIRLATRTGRPGDMSCWTEQRNRIYNQVMARGFHRERGSFVQAYDENVLDAALLYMPAVGFVTPSDPLWLSTLESIERDLVSDSLVHRYDPVHSPDGLPGHEGTFNMCTFWYVEALARSGRLDDARLTLEKMFTFSNHLGLYAEEIASTGEQIGNYPQAFSHLALINSALAVNDLLDAEADARRRR
ncbi:MULTISPECIES: glycoside hydrolase family 15 protein [unclassified Micromonospora]|uniref:glycoside hydrolase family 15 protein n=1 Tax=unclassified Micromonospora TaxID=2617518 RepID=UPI001B36FBCA|nr:MULTISPECIES: glycoside hydrolase family 15 protein [unclassified Micromonospora]MBQ1046587.1 glycoside hydrolase family 15 protein [Micromonospora sp. C72]MBQ1055836.1 glycoside hydrolase family 15 protein [Micromonospora sp. C32]